MALEDQLDGIFDDILASPPDLDSISLEVQEVRTAEWVDADGGVSWGVLLRATGLLRTHVPQLLIADGQLEHRNTGSCPSPAAGHLVRDVDCRACQVLGTPRTS
jgi:hypothetical protein